MDFLRTEGREDIAIEVDGNITPENGRKLKDIGAGIFVCGTSAIFKGDVKKYKENIEVFRNYVK